MSTQQLHKRLDNQTVAAILERYLTQDITSAEAMACLGIKRSRFFEILQAYQNDIDSFSVAYGRTAPNNALDAQTDEAIRKELESE